MLSYACIRLRSRETSTVFECFSDRTLFLLAYTLASLTLHLPLSLDRTARCRAFDTSIPTSRLKHQPTNQMNNTDNKNTIQNKTTYTRKPSWRKGYRVTRDSRCPWVTRDPNFERRAGVSVTDGLSCYTVQLSRLV